MANPTISAWAPVATFTIAGASFAAVDINLTDVDNAPVLVTLTVPGGGNVAALRNPASWNAAGTQLLAAGAWAAGPVSVGPWEVTIAAGGAATDPATVTISDPSGANANGLLRLMMRWTAAGSATVEPTGGTLSIDRVIANPSILNVQVTSSLPVKELDLVSLGATVMATQSVNPAPGQPLPSLPALVSLWTEDAGNPAALPDFASVGSTASFPAPGATENLDLNFTIVAAYDLDGGGIGSATNPRNEEELTVTVTTISHGMILVLDRSGSMGGGLGGGGGGPSRWAAAVQAAHAWLDLFRAFRPGDLHKAGIVTFEHDVCNWTASAADDVTFRNPGNAAAATGMGSLSGFGDAAQLTLGAVQSCTPIGDALVKAYQGMASALNSGSGPKKGSVLLLTDGYENAGRVTIASTKGSAQTTFALERDQLDFADSLIEDRLFTVAVGSQVDEDRLNDLGESFYQLTSSTKEILPAFGEMLGEVLGAEPVGPSSADADALYFPVNAGEQRVAFLVPWATAAQQTLNIGWRLAGSAGSFTPVNPAAGTFFWRAGHGLVIVDIAAVTGGLAATEWRLRHMIGATAQPLAPDGALCMVDLMLGSKVGFDERRYFIGQPINLSCKLRLGGTRLTGATVAVDIARPGEGLGTFLAVNAPLYKQRMRDLPGDVVKRGDPPKGKGLMHAALLSLLEMDELPVVKPPAMILPGGAGGDVGNYSGSFADTLKEGTYTFRFRIDGTLPDGSPYSRQFVRSTWVGVKPDVLNVNWISLDDLPANTAGSLMTIIPKTRSGEFLGPFRTPEINMAIFSGSFDGDIIDNLDGSYSRRIFYRPGDRPVVTIDIYGQQLEPTGPRDTTNCWALWVAAFCCTINGILKFLGLRS